MRRRLLIITVVLVAVVAGVIALVLAARQDPARGATSARAAAARFAAALAAGDTDAAADASCDRFGSDARRLASARPRYHLSGEAPSGARSEVVVTLTPSSSAGDRGQLDVLVEQRDDRWLVCGRLAG